MLSTVNTINNNTLLIKQNIYLLHANQASLFTPFISFNFNNFNFFFSHFIINYYNYENFHFGSKQMHVK